MYVKTILFRGGCFTRMWGVTWRVSDCEELVGVTWRVSDCEELVGAYRQK